MTRIMIDNAGNRSHGQFIKETLSGGEFYNVLKDHNGKMELCSMAFDRCCVTKSSQKKVKMVLPTCS